jgi:signal peptidase II
MPGISADDYTVRATIPNVKEWNLGQVIRRHENTAGVRTWRSTILVVGTVSGLLVALDQVTKAQVTRWLGPDADSDRFNIVGEAIGFEFVRNTGVAFGLLQGRPWLVSLLAIAVLLAFLVAFWRDLPRHRLLQLAVGAILGGALGNLIDRFRLGYVVDFLAVGSFPRFNIADSAVTIGLILLIWFLLGSEQPVESDESLVNRNDEHDLA